MTSPEPETKEADARIQAVRAAVAMATYHAGAVDCACCTAIGAICAALEGAPPPPLLRVRCKPCGIEYLVADLNRFAGE